MDRRIGKEARTHAGSSDDCITALPLELRARIASLLPFNEAVQLTVLSWPWRHIHFHIPVVTVDFNELLCNFYDGKSVILDIVVALARRAQEASSSKVDTLSLVSNIDDRFERRHVARIIALADARVITFSTIQFAEERNAWSLDLPPSTRELGLFTEGHLVPAIAGPGAAALRKLSLRSAVLTELPRLPSLVSLDLFKVIVEAPFAPGAWCPLLEDLDLSWCIIRQARVDIRLQRLRSLHLTSVSIKPYLDATETKALYGVVTIDTPELIEFIMDSRTKDNPYLPVHQRTVTRDYRLFKLRAPSLRLLSWRIQYAQRMVIDVGRPGSVRSGGITLMATSAIQTERAMEQMMRMLQGLLPNVPPEDLNDVAKPYLTLGDWSRSDVPEDENYTPKQLTCDLKGLIMSHEMPCQEEGYQKVVEGIYVSDKCVFKEEH